MSKCLRYFVPFILERSKLRNVSNDLQRMHDLSVGAALGCRISRGRRVF